MPIGRYLLFAGESFYASGGWNDFKGVFATVEATRPVFLAYAAAWAGSPMADEKACQEAGLWYHVIDITTGKTVACLEGNYCGSNPDERDN